MHDQGDGTGLNQLVVEVGAGASRAQKAALRDPKSLSFVEVDRIAAVNALVKRRKLADFVKSDQLEFKKGKVNVFAVSKLLQSPDCRVEKTLVRVVFLGQSGE